MAKNIRMHAINRDGIEKYLVLYGDGGIEVYDTAGNKATVNLTQAANNYLTANSPTADQIRLVSIADFTLVVNTTVNLSAGSVTLDFTVSSTRKNYDVLISYNPASDSYHKTTDDTPAVAAGYFQYTVTDNGFASWIRDTTVGPTFRSPTARWNDSSENPMGFRVRFQREALADTVLVYDETGGGAGEKSLTKVTAFASYVFETDDEIWINSAGGDSLPEGWYAIASRVSDDAILLTGAYRDVNDASQTYSSGDKSDSDSNGITKSYEVSVNFNSGSDANPADLFDIALALQNSLQAAGADDALINWNPEDTGGQGKFQIVAPYRGTGTKVVSTYPPDSGQSLDQANGGYPFDFSDGTATDGSGSPATVTLDVDDRWLQVSAPGQASASIDAFNMPIKLVRTTVSPLVFDADLIVWSARLSGGESTNPIPSLWGNGLKIADIGFHRNRLVLAGGENIVFSQAGDFFNFFLNDADNIVDSDPIDVAISSDEVTLIDFIAPFRKTMVIFTKAGRQFELNAPEALTASTTAITAITRHETTSIRPAQIGHTLFFASPGRNVSSIFEYAFSDDRVTSIAQNITAHVDGLIPPNVRSLVASANNNAVYAIGTNCNVIYPYQFFWVGAIKEQSAWSKWTFPSTYLIDDIATIENDLFVLANSNGQRVIERIPISRQIVNRDTDNCFSIAPFCVSESGGCPSSGGSGFGTSGDLQSVSVDPGGSGSGSGSVGSESQAFPSSGSFSAYVTGQCPPSAARIFVRLAGVDAAICGCFDPGGIGSIKYQFFALGVDGLYEIPRQYGNECTATAVFFPNSNVFYVCQYTGPGCTVEYSPIPCAPPDPVFFNDLAIQVSFSSFPFKLLSVSAIVSTGVFPGIQGWNIFKWSVGTASSETPPDPTIGPEAVPNQLNCDDVTGSTKIVASGGTATVVIV